MWENGCITGVTGVVLPGLAPVAYHLSASRYDTPVCPIASFLVHRAASHIQLTCNNLVSQEAPDVPRRTAGCNREEARYGRAS